MMKYIFKLCLFRDDPALWIVNETTKDYFSFNGFNQNLENNDFSKSKRLSTKRMRGAQRSYYRYFSLKFIKTKLINNEPFNRTFLVYSNSTGNVYCAPCRLFGSKSVFATVGFSNWKKGEEKISQHENSISHKSCVLKMSQRGSVVERIDKQLILQVETEKMYWEKVLTRVAAVVKSLSSRGLPLRGHDDKFGSTHSGNFIMSLELIAEFDPFLSNHIAQYANKGKGSTSYLSFATFEQFVNIMAEKVKETIVNEIKDAKYFSIVVDSTPDISHSDQLSLIFRYIKKNGEPVERFLQFFANARHKSEDMADAVFMALGANDLDIKNCRGQSYDNASNMSGMYSGLQARIKEACIHAVYIPCAAHSLNLFGECAASCCTQANDFFYFLQNTYTFFSSSTNRWNLLNECVSKSERLTVKRLSDTRWSGRHDACLSLSRNWNEIIKALNIIIHSSTEKSTTKCEAKSLLKNLKSLEMGILTTLWNDILEKFNCISKNLQSVHIDLTTVVTLYKSLIYYIQDLRNSFAFYETLGKEKSGVDQYKIERKRKRKMPYGESNQNNSTFKQSDSFRVNTFTVILDSLLTELNKRKSAYDTVNIKFGFLFNLTKLPLSKVREQAIQLQLEYSEDLGSSFSNECINFRSHLSGLEDNNLPLNVLDLYNIIKDPSISSLYPYIEIALRMYLCSPVSNCSAERSFSALKRIKSYLRSTIDNDRLNPLAILSIESEITSSLKYKKVIEEFSLQKAHRKI